MKLPFQSGNISVGQTFENFHEVENCGQCVQSRSIVCIFSEHNWAFRIAASMPAANDFFRCVGITISQQRGNVPQ